MYYYSKNVRNISWSQYYLEQPMAETLGFPTWKAELYVRGSCEDKIC